MTAVGLDRLSGGRFILGLGASGPQVIEGFHGVAYDRPLGRTREIMDICHSVWRRDRLVHDGAHYQVPLAEGRGTGLGKPLKLIDHPVRDRIPIYVASLGPKNVEMTAERWPRAGCRCTTGPTARRDVWDAALPAGLARRDPGLPPLRGRRRRPAGDRGRRRRTCAISRGPSSRCTSAAWARAAGTSTTTCSGATASRRRRRRSRMPTWMVTGRRPRRWCPAELVSGMSLIGGRGLRARPHRRLPGLRASRSLTCSRLARAAPRDIETVAGWLAG